MLFWPHVVVPLLLSFTAAEEPDDEDEPVPNLAPGLVAKLHQEEKTVFRVDEDVAFDWGGGSPDVRLGDGPFEARWTGLIRILPGGEYRFAVWLQGRVKVQVAGQTVLEGESLAEASVIEGPPARLAFGPQTLEVVFQKASKNARCQLYWSSRSFEREPVPATALFHEPNLRADSATRGEELVLALRCSSCHEVGLPTVRAASLDILHGSISPEWLHRYLSSQETIERHIPEFGLTPDERDALVAFLLSHEPLPKPKPIPNGNAQRGRGLVERIGCLACHRIGEAGGAGPFGGPDLTNIANKRPREFFSTWLTDPASLNRRHRMPFFDLDSKEVADAAAYLATLGKPPSPSSVTPGPREREQGRELFARYRCAQCHERDGFSARPDVARAVDPFAALSRSKTLQAVGQGCLGEANPATDRPGYRLNEADASAIREFLAGRPTRKNACIVRQGKYAMKIHNCQACHARGVGPGLRDVVAGLGRSDRKEQAELVPPTLESVGAKLNRQWLAKAVQGNAPRQRPWLAPRMPKFPFDDGEVDHIVDYLVSHDEVPATPSSPPDLAKESVLLASHRLVGAAGFGCMSCHAVGGQTPAHVEAVARGPDLKGVGSRIRYEWFRRWTRNPNRIAPGIEMPGINLASPGVLDGNVETQLWALWQGLNDSAFEPPAYNAVQSLSAVGRTRSIIFRDLFEHKSGDHTTRPFAVGFPNGHSILLDLDRFAFRRWWFGDFANQYTRGKTWYWQTSGVTLWDDAEALPLVGLERDGRIELPIRSSQAIALLQGWRRQDDHVVLRCRLQFPHESSIDLEVALAPRENGLQAVIGVIDCSQGGTPVLLRDAGRRERDSFETSLGPAVVSSEPAGRSVQIQGAPAHAVPLHHPVRWEWKLAKAVEPVSTIPRIASAAQPRKVLPAIPGYEVVRLALPAEVMPTAMANRPDGRLLVTSLKGGVFLASDNDHDGEIDSYQPYFDELAAPFGVMASGDEVLVGHKHELLRLFDDDRDDFCERAEVVSTGWGVTFDYHDWMVGPVPDEQGGYFLALSCQQDKRSPAEALGRGKLIRTRPGRGFDIVCHGLRFPMGLIRGPSGDIFATDNQGVTNPFNELNHLRPGRHYGFFNALEEQSNGQFTEPAAIQIPHPWTGSVNGLAFVPADGGFGPFGGHLIGAEYTTRRLIRMSVQPVGETFQGCVYPFGEVDRGLIERDEAFLGPISLCFLPDGRLYVGSMIDSGWGGGNNRGAIEQVRFTGELPLGIREVRAWNRGLDIDFTKPVDKRYADPKLYRISRYRRVHTSGYATPDRDRADATITNIEAIDDDTIRLRLDTMREGFVYEIGVTTPSGVEEILYPAIAYYTLQRIP